MIFEKGRIIIYNSNPKLFVTNQKIDKNHETLTAVPCSLFPVPCSLFLGYFFHNHAEECYSFIWAKFSNSLVTLAKSLSPGLVSTPLERSMPEKVLLVSLMLSCLS